MNKTTNTTQRATRETIYKWKGKPRNNLPSKYRNKLLPLFTKYAARRRSFEKDQREKKDNTRFRLSEKELEEAYTKSQLYFLTKKRASVSQLFNEFYRSEYLPGLVVKALMEERRIEQEEIRRLREQKAQEKRLKQQQSKENMVKKKARAERRRQMERNKKSRESKSVSM